MLKYYDSIGQCNWVTDIKHVLYSSGFGYVWENQGVLNNRHFLLMFLNRLKDQYIQTWRGNVSTNAKLAFYMDFKQIYSRESYIDYVDVSKFMKALAMFRSSSHSLMVEKGRYHNIGREERTCVFCEIVVEDEFHFVLICPLYESIRQKYIPQYYL